MLSTEHRNGLNRRGLGRRAVVGTVAAVIGVSACFLAASLAGTTLKVAVGDMPETSVPFGAGVAATAAAGVGAYLLARLCLRATRPRRVFLLLTMAGLLASAVPPVQAATTAQAAIWLLVMHVAAAIALVPVVASALPSTRPARAFRPTAATPAAPSGPAEAR